MLMPTDAALSPTRSTITPPIAMARGRPLPAFSALSPSAAKRPVPMIIAAVRSMAVVLPKARRSDDFGSDRLRFIGAFVTDRLRLRICSNGARWGIHEIHQRQPTNGEHLYCMHVRFPSMAAWPLSFSCYLVEEPIGVVPADSTHERVDVAGRFGAEVHVVGVFIHIEGEDR